MLAKFFGLKNLIFFFAFPLISFLFLFSIYKCLFAILYLFRGAYCAPGYLELFLQGIVLPIGLIALIFLAGPTLLTKSQLRYWKRSQFWAYIPVILFLLVFGFLIVDEILNVQASRAYCEALPHPEAGDGKAPKSDLSPLINYAAGYSSIGFFISLIMVFILGLLPRR